MAVKLKTPISDEQIKKLKAGDVVYISGEIVTARDRAHQRALELDKGEVPASFEIIYHCGPLVERNKEWRVISCGPTTSARFEKYIAKMIKKFGTKIIVGKGGIETKNCVYLCFTGGCGVLAARAVKKVKAVHWLDLGMPEAVFVLEVKNFGPLVVAIDAHGNSLFKR
ncbi:MAG: FumA C-terminus/TtdB family hydratase beta subunit [Candidatus Hydrothermarchaeota archaeon]|nr:FumA C-terminus/TtdB family hydratase beta subunit [Candidatus Hydrothermarchaeota archaeon]